MVFVPAFPLHHNLLRNRIVSRAKPSVVLMASLSATKDLVASTGMDLFSIDKYSIKEDKNKLSYEMRENTIHYRLKSHRLACVVVVCKDNAENTAGENIIKGEIAAKKDSREDRSRMKEEEDSREEEQLKREL
ncbi:hypothetical protein LIER_06062 [Lithospermum erythrorhizon]|uniref:Uncharacterized protein n=1 Tax=Lithospermum erythrorhizon TaxID=34254 RepID=A0AAV3P4G4_LITER